MNFTVNKRLKVGDTLRGGFAVEDKHVDDGNGGKRRVVGLAPEYRVIRIVEERDIYNVVAVEATGAPQHLE